MSGSSHESPPAKLTGSSIRRKLHVRLSCEQASSVSLCRVTDAAGLGQLFAYGKFDGIFGLGWPALANNGVTPPVIAMYQQGFLTKSAFSFQLGHADKEDGELLLGGWDETLSIRWIPLVSKDYWVSLRLAYVI